MLTFNFNDLNKGETITGGLTPVRLILTALALKLKGHKPVIYRNENVQETGWFIRKGKGGKSGEPLVRMNFGTSYSSFHAYDRNGKPRVGQTKYVPIKDFLIQKKIA
tara:strand:+ start:108 stop:428 length:321 start_codon:yes stop_codon:yes gene_type:complete